MTLDHVHRIFTEAGHRAQIERGFSDEHRLHLSEAHRGKPHPHTRHKPLQEKARSKVGYKGVSILNGKWTARITVQGKVKFIGVRAGELQAAILYDNAAEKLYGQRPNGTSREDQQASSFVRQSSLNW